jgi:ABC-2 type transport system ATP-binding protein
MAGKLTTLRLEQRLAVCADHLTKAFEPDRQVLTDISFEVPAGTIVGFIGPSGCGKTTLVRLMTGAHAPTDGSVRVLGVDPTELSRSDRQEIGYLPQTPVLFRDLTVWHNLNFHASLNGVGFRRRQQLRDLIAFVELDGHEEKRVSQLSGGMQRRLALAAALVHDPRFLFLDEPTAGIDPILRQKFWERFRSLRDEGRTLIVTTQHVSEAASCDLVAVLSEGRLVTIDTPDGLRRRAFGADLVDVSTSNPVYGEESVRQIEALPGVHQVVERVDPLTLRLSVDDSSQLAQTLSDWCESRGVRLAEIREHVPDYDDVFVRIVEDHRASLGGES